jgi:hypothetical protein
MGGFGKLFNIIKIMEENEKTPFTWAKLKEFCNTLSDEQLLQEVKVLREEDYINIGYASELGNDHYYFIDDEYSTTKEDYDPEVFNGLSFEEALALGNYTVASANNVYLFEDI